MIKIKLCLIFISIISFVAAEQGVQAAETGVKNDVEEKPISLPTVKTRSDLWRRYIRGMRKDHNFAFSSGFSSGSWQIDRFGTLSGERYFSQGYFSKFQYSFHLPIYGSFGYLLGSSFGYHHETERELERFRSAPAVHLPGFLAGLVFNASLVWRFAAAIDVYLERVSGLKDEVDELSEQTGAAEDSEISITFRTYDLVIMSDFFYSLNWGVRLEGHFRRVNYLKPTITEQKDIPVDADISKQDSWYGIGIIYHFL